jgi:hypothetical protein
VTAAVSPIETRVEVLLRTPRPTSGAMFMKIYKKKDFPVGQIRRFLEPGPIVLVSSA